MIIFDLDNCLRNNEGSLVAVPADVTKARNWIPWQEWVNENGTQIEAICTLYAEAVKSGVTVGIVTSSSFGTKEWLDKFEMPQPSFIIERDLDDDRSPYDYKVHFIVDNLGTILLWVDDSNKVCDFAELNEIPTVRVTDKLGAIKYDH